MISKGERELVEYVNRTAGSIIGVSTVNQAGNVFYFYEFNGKDYKKIGKASSPPELERKYNLNERMGVKK